MPAYANPFRAGAGPTFRPQTDAGRALQAASYALLSGPTPAEQEALAAKNALNQAHMALYGAQAEKAGLEAQAMRDRAAAGSPDAVMRAVAQRLGVPEANVRGYTDYVGGKNPMPAALPGGVSHRELGDTLFAVNTALMGKDVGADELSRALGQYQQQGVRRDVLAGTADPTRAALAGFVPQAFKGGQFGVVNEATGEQSLNEIGVAHAGAERALGNQRNSQAGQNAAETRQIDAITRAGVGGRFGAPVAVNDPEAGPILTAPSSAIGRAPAARPLDPATAALRESGARLNDVRAGAGGFAPRGGAAPQAKPLSKAEQDMMAATVAALAGGKLDPTVSARVMARAAQIAQDPTSEWHRNPSGAAEAAVQEIAPGGFENTGVPLVPFTGTGRVPKGGAAPAAQAAPTGTTQAAPPAAQRVKDRVYQTPRGPMKWTGSGWVPPDA